MPFLARSGRVAVYTGAKDEALEANPFLDLSRIKFHSDLPYFQILQNVSGTASIDATGYSGEYPNKSVNLFAHNLGFRPLIFGKVWNNKPMIGTTGENPFSGTIPWWGDRDHGSTYLDPNIMHLHLSVDDTYVRIWLRAAMQNLSPVAVTFNYLVWVTDRELPPGSGQTNPDPISERCLIKAGRMQVKDIFDSEQLHIRKNAGTELMPIAQGKTVFPSIVSGSDDVSRPVYSIYDGGSNKQYSMLNAWAGVQGATAETPATVTVGA